MKDNTIPDSPVFDLKGSVVTVMVLHLRTTDAAQLYPQLVQKVEQGRAFFTNAPVLIDISELDEAAQLTFDCHELADTLRKLGMVPIAVRGAVAFLHEQVVQAGMGLLPATREAKTADSPTEFEPPATQDTPGTTRTTAPAPPRRQPQPRSQPSSPPQQARPTTRVVNQTVRSGQKVFAPAGDLIVLASVNAGAEVLAAGNIHVYGALRGRALAGIHGDTTARIFSLQCNPELVAVAGEYMVNESLKSEVVNQSIVISLADDRLLFTPLGSQQQERH
ncbi:MAG: septum site-determining protein MinC [Desulfopila sp.]